MHELLGLTLIELTETLRARKASPVDLMNAVLARIDETNGDLNAVVALRDRDQLLADAKLAEQRIARSDGRALEGIPLGVKDLEDVAGMTTSHGSLLFREHVPKRDSVQVARLRAAGAIVVGKTNAPEFGHTAITKNLVYGVTRSPWNLEVTPGGSSGGSAAAMAANVLPLVTSSDGGGSIRIPASFTGTFGHKPSYGRIPNGPDENWYYGDTAVVGPTTKTVEDAGLFLDQTVGASPYDPNSLPHPGISYLQAIRDGLQGKLRIGYSPDLGYAVVQSDVAAAVEDGVRVFEKLGHKVEQFAGGPPLLGREWALWNAFELAARLHRVLPGREGDITRSIMDGINVAKNMTPDFFGVVTEQRAALNEWCAEIFDRYDVLVTPTVPYDPPPARGPFPDETEGRKQVLASVASFTIPFNLSFHPAATVRVGMSKAHLPIGLQIVGPRHRDDLVLQVARAFERERPWHPAWAVRW